MFCPFGGAPRMTGSLRRASPHEPQCWCSRGRRAGHFRNVSWPRAAWLLIWEPMVFSLASVSISVSVMMGTEALARVSACGRTSTFGSDFAASPIAESPTSRSMPNDMRRLRRLALSACEPPLATLSTEMVRWGSADGVHQKHSTQGLG